MANDRYELLQIICALIEDPTLTSEVWQFIQELQSGKTKHQLVLPLKA